MTRHSFEQPTPSAQSYSPGHLYDELNQIACRNHDFRDGIVGSSQFQTSQSELTYPSDTLDPEDDGRWPTPVLSEEYSFTAVRLPTPGHTHTTSFLYSYKDTLSGIALPMHIAEEAYGLKGEEAVENGGPSTLEHAIQFTVDDTKELHVCEAFIYTDEENDEIMQTCSCAHMHDANYSSILPKRSFTIDYTQDTDDSDHYLPALDQSVQYGTHAARTLEHIDALSPSETHTHERVGMIIDKNKGVDDLVVAFHVLHSMKKAFRRQLGLRL